MKRMLRCVAAAVSVIMIALLCGCDGFITDTEKLIMPPALTGEMKPINEALSESVKKDYKLVYPSAGDNRSAIALFDIEKDGVNEAFAFYSITGGENAEMHINYIKKSGSGWKSVADNKLEASGVDKVEFCDLNGDGVSEILVGWEIYGSGEKKLGVYSTDGKKLLERMMESYTSFVCRDLDGDKKQELFVQKLFISDGSNIAEVYNFTRNGVNKTATCLMDGKVKSANAPVISKLTDGRTAIYIDEEKGTGYVTEVLLMENGELKNPMFDGNKGENTLTQCTLPLECSDINGDGFLEIPTAIEMPMADGSGEKSYYTNWCGYDGKTLTIKTVTIINQTDGYYLVIPNKLFDNLALSRNVERNIRTFYDYNRETAKAGKRLFSITVMKEAESKDYLEKNKNAVKIGEKEQSVFIAEVFDEDGKINISEVKEMFKITE